MKRKISRRELLRLGLAGAGMLSARSLASGAQEQDQQFAGLDHFEFYVSNVEKSRDFFVRIFGNTLLSRNGKRYLKLGSTYMAFEAPRGNAVAGQVDHVSLAIKQLDMMKLHASLQQRGIVYQDYPSGRDTAVLDPDGTRLQLSPEHGWSLLNPATFLPETVALPEAPVFGAITLDHALFNVRDEKSTAHYTKLLGAPSLRSDDVAWFQTGTSRIGISPAREGQRAGVRHIAISVAAFNSATATDKLKQLGAQVESSESTGTLRFRDPDGLVLQVSINS
jgi:catechol 2,3-dioxygenase-like lactoylglutathione lyase family enzyme